MCCCPFSLCLSVGTMPGCGAFVGSSNGAKREYLKSEKHKPWQKAKRNMRAGIILLMRGLCRDQREIKSLHAAAVHRVSHGHISEEIRLEK